MAFVWTKSIETGNELIDSEHKELLNKINDFMNACSQGKGRSEILSTLNFLKTYTDTHFSHEEELQQKSNYPDYIRHRQLHKEFNRSLNKIEHKFLTEGASIAMVSEINQNIGNWLVGHIKTEDIKLSKYLAEKM